LALSHEYSEPPTPARERSRLRAWFAGLAIFVLTAVAFYLCPANQLTDSMYSMLLSETILRQHSVDLKYAHLKAAGSPDNTRDGGVPYETILVNGRLLYYLGWGSSVLSLPGVAVFNAAGVSTLGADGNYDWHGEMRIQRALASIVAAGAVGAIFCAGLTAGLPVSWAASIALATAFGTQVWSGASRSLWPQTWVLLLLSTAIWLLLKWDGCDGFRPVLIATLLSWMYFVRPASAFAIGVISIYVLLTWPKHRLAYVASGLAWLAAFIAFSFHFFHAPLPPYYHELGLLRFSQWPSHLAGLVLSPSRGMLIYCPALIFALYLPLRWWNRVEHKRLAIMAGGAIAANLAVLSGFKLWWGGWSYGPRELSDTIPFFALLAIVGCKAFLADHSVSAARRIAVVALGIVLVVLSVAVNAPGALSDNAFAWNAWADVDYYPERLWDWSHAQFLAPFFQGPPKEWTSHPQAFSRHRMATAPRVFARVVPRPALGREQTMVTA
jgi:hypothetical protein